MSQGNHPSRPESKTYRSNDELPRIIAATIDEYTNTNPSPTHKSYEDWNSHHGFLRIDSIEPLNTRKAINLNAPPPLKINLKAVDDKRRSDAIRNASTFFIGGLLHDDNELAEKAIARIAGILPEKTRGKLIENMLVYSPHVNSESSFSINGSRAARVNIAYAWNANKEWPYNDGKNPIKIDMKLGEAEDLENLAKQIFHHRFRNEEGRLLTSKEFNGFNFLTYSIGGRLAFIVENMLRKTLRDALDGRAGSAKLTAIEQNKVIQQYFDKCRIISIGHALDWEDFPKNMPQIPKRFLFGKDDNGVYVRQSFVDSMKDIAFDGKPAVDLDVNKHFHFSDRASQESHHATILGDSALKSPDPIDGDTHGIPKYTNALFKHRDTPAIKAFMSDLETAIDPIETAITPRLKASEPPVITVPPINQLLMTPPGNKQAGGGSQALGM